MGTAVTLVLRACATSRLGKWPAYALEPVACLCCWALLLGLSSICPPVAHWDPPRTCPTRVVLCQNEWSMAFRKCFSTSTTAWTLSVCKPIKSAKVHGIVTSLSPMKGHKYFEGCIADNTTSMRLVGFAATQQKELATQRTTRTSQSCWRIAPSRSRVSANRWKLCCLVQQ